jgi:signal transduction histidine kinase
MEKWIKIFILPIIVFLVMQYQLDKWQISLVTDYCTETIFVSGNADRLEQVFINIIANAYVCFPDLSELRFSRVLKLLCIRKWRLLS